MTAEHWLSTVTSCSTRCAPLHSAVLGCSAAVLHKQYSPVPAVMLQYCCMLCTAPGKCQPLLWRILLFCNHHFCRAAAADRRRRSWPTLGCCPCRGWGVSMSTEICTVEQSTDFREVSQFPEKAPIRLACKDRVIWLAKIINAACWLWCLWTSDPISWLLTVFKH